MSKKEVIKIDTNFDGYCLDSFFIPLETKQYLDRVLIPNGLVNDRIEKIAYEIALEYVNKPFVALCILKGGLLYFNKLIDKLKKVFEFWAISGQTNYNTNQITMEFIQIQSYKDDCSTDLKILNSNVLENLKGKNVLVVEDIIDTGRTINKLTNLLKLYDIKLKITSLVVKRKNKQIALMPDFACFEIPDYFIVGYNFDYNEHFRDLKHICIINENGKKKFSIKD